MANLEIQKKYIDTIAKYDKNKNYPYELFDSLEYNTLEELTNICGLYLIAELFSFKDVGYKYVEDSAFDFASNIITGEASLLTLGFVKSKLQNILNEDQLKKLESDFFEEFYT